MGTVARKMVISNVVRGVLSELETKGNTCKIVRQLDPTLYKEVNKILEALGGKWSRKEQCHVFDVGVDAAEKIDNVLLSGECVDMKKAFDFFQTPPKVVAELIERAQLPTTYPLRILEPSAGKGAIAKVILLKRPSAFIQLVEIQPENCIALRADGFKNVDQADFIQWSCHKPFDRIIMNPPFSKKQEIAHVIKAYSHLKIGGRLVAVMSSGVEFRQDQPTLRFKDFVYESGGEISPLPEESFKTSGTSVNTVLVVLKK